MEKVFIELIKQLNSSVFILLGVVGGAFILAWKLSAFISTWKTKHRHHETALAKIEKKIDMIPAMSGKLELIYNNTLIRPVVASHSPTSLTDFGKEIATNIKADGFVERHYSLFLDRLGADYRRLNAFDIQKILFSYIGGEFKENLSHNEMDTVKTEAYERGLQDTDILQIIAVLARDKVLLDLGREIKEVDKHNTAI